MNAQKTYEIIDVIIKSFKKARAENDYNTLMLSGLALLEYTPALIEYSVSQEAEYRKFEARTLDTVDENGKYRSSAYADAQAKSTEFYREWNKSKQMIELIYELVAMSKKLAGNVDKDFNSQFNN